ncbi:MAG: MCE family protein [Nitrospirae bacterium]|nr:MAG: MCE family protein [Nitrospirota bacterium]
MAYLKEEIKAGVIILSAALILSGFVIFIGGSGLFEKFDTYYVKVTNSAGLEEGAQVRLGGVRVGRVLNIKTPETAGDPVTITVGIKKGTPVFKGSKAVITQVGLVGDLYLLLTLGNAGAERFSPGDLVPADEQLQFGEMMAKVGGISQSVDSLIKDMNGVFSKKNIQNIEKLIDTADKTLVSSSSNFDKIATALKNTNDKLSRVLGELEDMMKENKGEAAHLLKKAKDGIEKANAMMKYMEDAASEVGKTSKSVGSAVDRQSKNIEALVLTLQKTSEDLRDVMHEIKHKPWSIIHKERSGDE